MLYYIRSYLLNCQSVLKSSNMNNYNIYNNNNVFYLSQFQFISVIIEIGILLFFSLIVLHEFVLLDLSFVIFLSKNTATNNSNSRNSILLLIIT